MKHHKDMQKIAYIQTAIDDFRDLDFYDENQKLKTLAATAATVLNIGSAFAATYVVYNYFIGSESDIFIQSAILIAAVAAALLIEFSKIMLIQKAAKAYIKKGIIGTKAVAAIIAISVNISLGYFVGDSTPAPKLDNFDFAKSEAAELSEDIATLKKQTYKGILSNKDKKQIENLQAQRAAAIAKADAAKEKAEADAQSLGFLYGAIAAAAEILAVCLQLFLCFFSWQSKEDYLNGGGEPTPPTPPTNFKGKTTKPKIKKPKIKNVTLSSSKGGAAGGQPAPEAKRLKKLYSSYYHNSQNAKNKTTQDENLQKMQIIAAQLKKIGETPPSLRA